MSDPDQLGDLFADDALLDRLAAREGAGDDPVALLLGSLASYVDQPIGQHRPVGRHRALVSTRRPSRGQRIAVAGVMAVVMSGAGFAAALSIPDGPDRSTVPQQQVRVGGSGATGTPRPVGPTGRVAPTTFGRDPSQPAPGAGTVGAVPPGQPAAERGAAPPASTRHGQPPGLVSGPGTAAAATPAESENRRQRGRPTDLPTPSANGRTAHPPAPPTSGSAPSGKWGPSTSPTAG